MCAVTTLHSSALSRQWATTIPALVLGTACVVAGGLVAAATSVAPTEYGAWAAAYLVLVGGVAQLGIALGQTLLATRPTTPSVLRVQFTAWNLGNAAVIAGTLAELVPLVGLGSALLIVTLVLTLYSTRGARGAWPLYTYRVLVGILLLGIAVGIVLSALG